MPPKLRPRWKLPPADHNYAKTLTHLPVYGSWPVILSGPEGIFRKVAIEPKVKSEDEEGGEIDSSESVNEVKITKKRNRSVSENVKRDESAEEIAPKRKRRKFFKGTTFEPKRRKRKRATNGEQSITQTPKESDGKIERGFNDSGISSDFKESVKAELDENTNSLKINQSEMPLTDGAILLQPSADSDGAPGLYNLSIASASDSSACTYLPQPVKMKRICSSCTSECQWRRKRCPSHQPESDSRRQSERLIKMNYKFPFEKLPDVCKRKIFSYLSLIEKGIAAQVCGEWNSRMKSPGLWSHMNLAVFNPTTSPVKSKSNRNAKTMPNTIFHGAIPLFSNYIEYDDYKNRVCKFLEHMREIKPKLRTLSFSYDIGQPKDEWLKWMTGLLTSGQCLDLTYANIDWTWTPLRLLSSDRYCCLFNKMQIKYRMHEKRVRSFNELQKVLAKVAPKLAHLKTPFDWSPRSVLLMCRLKQVRTLQLGQYMMLKGVQQEMMDTLLRNMPQLRELEIKICSPYHNSRTTYSITHRSLELLDISMCKGFFLHELKCPKLTVLKLGRYPWKGPIVNKETNKLSCIYTLCRRGTPRLAYINRHHIQAYWVEFLYDELNTVLCKVCSCKDHLYREPVIQPPEPDPEDQPNNVDNNENVQVPAGIQGGIVPAQPQVEAAINIIPNVNNGILHGIDPPLANIVPLYPLLDDDGEQDNIKPSTSNENSKSQGFGTSKYVVDDAIPSTSTDPRAQGKSCAKFKAKRSKCLPVPLETNDSENSDADDQQDIPIEHSTVEVRSTPRITLPTLGAPTHVAVIPIRVVDPSMLSQSPTINPVPIAFQSIALQPQVIAVDKATGTHVVSGPLTVVKHIIQVKATPVSIASTVSTPVSEDPRNVVTLANAESDNTRDCARATEPTQSTTTSITAESVMASTEIIEPVLTGITANTDESKPPINTIDTTVSLTNMMSTVQMKPEISVDANVVCSGKTTNLSVMHKSATGDVSPSENSDPISIINAVTTTEIISSENSGKNSELATNEAATTMTVDVSSNPDVISTVDAKFSLTSSTHSKSTECLSDVNRTEVKVEQADIDTNDKLAQ